MQIADARRQRLRTAGPWVLDGLLAVVAGAGVATLATVLPFDPGSPRAWAAYLLVLAHTLPIAVRRRWPLAVLAWGLATGAAFAALGLNLVSLTFAVLVYVYTVAAHRPRRASLAGLAATEALLVVVWLARPRAIGDGGTLVVDGLVMAAGWWLGDGARRRQEAAVIARQRAAELELAREELARRAVTEERLRIARELHDVVAHSMSIIAVQSGVGVHVLDSQPEEARKALAAIEATSRQALVEMRRLLGVLRQGAEPRGSLAPAPGLAEVEALAAEVARAGVRVEVRIEGTPYELPAGLDLSAYRIVQEALTNVVRHAGPATARVEVRYAPGRIALEVVDDGRGASRGPRRARHRGHARAGRPLRRHARGRPPARRRLPGRGRPAGRGPSMIPEGPGNPTTARPAAGRVPPRPQGPGNPTTARPAAGRVPPRPQGPGNPRGVPR
jgi:signal transduction histidine kinase